MNADQYASTGQGIAGHNMFSYCNNNPVLCSDSGGDKTVPASGIDERNMNELMESYLSVTGEPYSLPVYSEKKLLYMK